MEPAPAWSSGVLWKEGRTVHTSIPKIDEISMRRQEAKQDTACLDEA
jgi:hypothetical protein